MEYKNDHFAMNIFREFLDKDEEADFMEYQQSANLIIVRVLTLLMGIVFVMFTFFDYYFYGAGSNFLISAGLRIVALFITIISFLIIGKFKHYEQSLMLVSLTEFAVFIIYMVNLYILKASEFSLQFMSMMLFVLIVYLIPNRLKNCFLTACSMITGYIIFSFAFLDHSGSPSLWQCALYLFICLLACTIFLLGKESSERRHYTTMQFLEFISITDRLTGIYNRGRFEHTLNLWIKNMRHDPFCLVLFDIDNFKEVNDTFGHSAGDQVLIGITEIVTANIRDDDIFARWGGEEFVILFGSTSIERAKELAERLRKAVENKSYGNINKVTISAGVTLYKRGETIIDLVNRADAKMYEAKRNGKNQIEADTPAENSQ